MPPRRRRAGPAFARWLRTVAATSLLSAPSMAAGVPASVLVAASSARAHAPVDDKVPTDPGAVAVEPAPERDANATPDDERDESPTRDDERNESPARDDESKPSSWDVVSSGVSAGLWAGLVGSVAGCAMATLGGGAFAGILFASVPTGGYATLWGGLVVLSALPQFAMVGGCSTGSLAGALAAAVRGLGAAPAAEVPLWLVALSLAPSLAIGAAVIAAAAFVALAVGPSLAVWFGLSLPPLVGFGAPAALLLAQVTGSAIGPYLPHVLATAAYATLPLSVGGLGTAAAVDQAWDRAAARRAASASGEGTPSPAPLSQQTPRPPVVSARSPASTTMAY